MGKLLYEQSGCLQIDTWTSYKATLMMFYESTGKMDLKNEIFK